MKYYLVVGEASGDLHASNLMAELKKADPQADFRFFGGDLMAAQGGVLVKHYKEMAYMGFFPVLFHLRTISNNMKLCKKDILEYRPDVVILVDYPGFNLSVAKYVKENSGIPVYYYISPKIWAWKEYRIKSIKRYVDELFSILPFEVDFYQKHHFPVHYVGNPSVDSVDSFRKDYTGTFEDFTRENSLSKRRIIALLPGSRKQEIRVNLPRMLAAITPIFTDYQIIIAGAPGIDQAYYKKHMLGKKAVILYGKTYEILAQAQVALVVSGTATLEAALLNVPQAVVYHMSPRLLVKLLRKLVLKVKYISLVNLIAGKEVVKELVTERYIIESIRNATRPLLFDADYVKAQRKEYAEIRRKLGGPGASEKAAREMTALLKKRMEDKER